MVVNDGKVYKERFSQKSNVEQLQAAEVFSEGSKALKELLLFLWGRGVETKACCAGHADVFRSVPYISIFTDNISDKVLSQILINLCNNDIVEMILVKNRVESVIGHKELSIYLKQYYHSFDSILDCFKNAYSDYAQKERIDKLANLSDNDRNFVLDVVAVNNVDVSKFNITKFRTYYEHLPETVSGIGISRIKGEIKYSVSPKIFGALFWVDGISDAQYISQIAYTKLNNEFAILNSDRKVVWLSEEEIKQNKLLEHHEYLKLLENLFYKDRETFLKFLSMGGPSIYKNIKQEQE